MPASYPKPDDQRRNRVEPRFGWVDLPAAGRVGEPPGLPVRVDGAWSSQTLDAWSDLWSSPQSTQWDQSGRTLHRWAICHEDVVRYQAQRDPVPASLLSEMRQLEDRHGLSPKAMLQLRWRIAETEAVSTRRSRSSSRMRDRLSVVDGSA